MRLPSEDMVLVNEFRKVFGVFDGAVSLDKYLSPEGKTGAFIAASIAASTFAQTYKDLDTVALVANDNIEKAHRLAGIDTRQSVNRFGTTVAVVKIVDDDAELLQIGDSIILVIHMNGRAEVPLGYHNHDIDLLRKWHNLATKGTAGILGVLASDVIKLRESANSEFGLLNGDKKFKTFLNTTSISLHGVASILLLTDGMYIPKLDPGLTDEWDLYAKLYRKGGLNKIYKTVREMETSDPKLIKYPRYTLHDDASGIAIDFRV